MNLFVDEHIAFEYPADYLLEGRSPQGEYAFQRGCRSVILLLSDKATWDKGRHIARNGAENADRMSGFLGAPRFHAYVKPFNAHGMSGEAYWLQTLDDEDRIITQGTQLFVRRGAHYLCVRMDNVPESGEEWLADMLRSVAFPGEEAYQAARRRGPRRERRASPYAVELPHLAKFGRAPRETGATFNVEYTGQAITPQQEQALNLLVQGEKAIFYEARKRIFRYYTESVYPLIESMSFGPGSEELFPRITELRQITPLVELGSILVHEPRRNGTAPIGLRFDCQWDEEHGLGVRVVGTTVEAVGPDEVALIPDTPSHE